MPRERPMPRKRQYSWSRISREHKAVPLGEIEQQKIGGDAHLCFAPDGEWFQGYIEVPNQLHIKVHGRRLLRSSVIKPIASPSSSDSSGSLKRRDSTQLSLADSGHSSAGGRDEGLDTPRSSASESNDSIDSELVAAVMDKLSTDFEEDEGVMELTEPLPNEERHWYAIKLTFNETGQGRRIDRALVRRNSSVCHIDNENIKFSSDTVLKGTMADVFVHQNMSPNAGLGLGVYSGPMSVLYQDEVCNPVADIRDTQWCL